MEVTNMGNEGFVAARVRERGRIFMRVMGQCNLKSRFKPKLIHCASCMYSFAHSRVFGQSLHCLIPS